MAEILALAEVWLWGEYVGAVAEMDDRSITFEYADGFRRGGLEISPLLLPTARRIFTFGSGPASSRVYEATLPLAFSRSGLSRSPRRLARSPSGADRLRRDCP